MDPKVLIISETFNAGDAITGLNLFSKWNKKSLFIASVDTSFFFNNFNSGYRIGDAEIKKRIPFAFFNKIPSSKIIDCEEQALKSSVTCQSPFYKSFSHIVIPAMKWLGIIHFRARYKVSDQFLSWVDDVSPDCVYTSVGSLNMAEFIYDLMQKRHQFKYIIHGYDDWVTSYHYSITNKLYIKLSKHYLSSIMSTATLTLSTSEKMAEDYQERYRREFYNFPNPTQGISNSILKDNNSINITFIGKIGSHNIQSILMLASALSILNKNFVLQIYSAINMEVIKNKITKCYPKTVFHDWVSHEEIPLVLRNSRILYLPISINKQTMQYTKYSMSTKMSEYLSSGVPILYLGPEGIAMTELLEKYNCAFVVKDNDKEYVASVIKEILDDKKESEKVVSNAMSLFLDKFEIDKVTSNFKETVNSYVLEDNN